MSAPNTINDNNDNNNEDDEFTLPPVNEIDWDAVMRDFSPPEWDLLLSAAAKNDLERVREFVERDNVPVTHSNGVGQTALHVAVLWGHFDMARYLIQAGANVNATNRLSGATPLHAALCSHKISPEQQAAMVRLLVEQGQANPVEEDSYGKAPIDSEYIRSDEKRTHPLFVEPKYETLKKQLTLPPLGEERLRENFLKQVVLGMPTCENIAD